MPGGSVIYPVEGEVKCSFAGWQGSICRVAIGPRLRPDIPFLFRLRGPYFGYFLFSFSLLFARKCIFEGIFSRMPNFFIFLNSFTVIGFFFFVILCRICRRLPPGVICVVPVDNVWYSNCYLQELTPLLKNTSFIIKVFLSIGGLRVLLLLSHAIVF